LSEDREGCSHSFILLYSNIADALKLRNRSPRARLHLEYEDYKEDKDLLQQIKSRSNIHNTKVSNFMGSVKSSIIKAVFTKDISLEITYNSYFTRNSSSIRKYLTPVKLELINIINNNSY
jgi:hypothetical protein